MADPTSVQERLAGLSREQRAALFEQIRKRKEGGEAAAERIPHRPAAAGPVPASFAQERLWFIDQLEPGSPAYNIPFAQRASGPLDAAALAASFLELVRRHEILRTVFRPGEAGPVQVIGVPGEGVLPRADLSRLGEAERGAEALRLTAEEALRPFDLATGPLLRATLLRLAEEEHALLVNLHHIVGDGWSAGVLMRELAALYEAFRRGDPSPLPELPIQYADFAVWQRHRFAGPAREEEIAWWRERLAGAPPMLALPTDRPRPPVQSFRGTREPLLLPADLAAALQGFCRRSGVTPFVLFLGAFATLLHRYTGEMDLAIGTPVAGRDHQETEGLIGCFVNTLVLRADLSGNPELGELLARLRQRVLAAYAHQDLPFEMLVEALQPKRSLAYEPLFQVMTDFHYRRPVPESAFSGLTWEAIASDQRRVHFDLVLTGEESEDLSGWLEYRTDLFDGTTIRRMAGHLRALLAAVLEDGGRTLAALPLLTAGERQQLLAEANAGAAFTLDSLDRRFALQAARRPAEPAVVSGVEALSYRDLDRRSNRLARRLRRLGVRPEEVVGICLERSPDLVVAVLAVQKAGGAYLPLDPAYPRERLAFMLGDSGARVIVTEERSAGALPESAAQRVRLDSRELEGEDDGPVASGVGPDNLAYVIYTSGSTGRPRGVLVTHGNVTRLLAATEAWLGCGENDVWTLFHSYAFDFSVWEMWGALAYGGRLVVVPYWVSRSPESFHALLAEEGVTVLNQTPSAFRQLMPAILAETPGASKLALRLVIFGGEALDLPSLAPWVARYGAARPRLVNMYGITETTVHVTYRPLAEGDVTGGRGSGIGRPIPDLALRVLGRDLTLQPIGAPGELCVSGAGLARGYLGRPELTAERFVPDPFGGSETGARLYRSGDLGRRLGDGDIEYLGRIDHQVKIRGFRIELGEIEAALSAHGEVRECAVLARQAEGTPGDTRLVAYVVSAETGRLSESALREHLERSLPEPMLPSAYLFLAALPLTSNGKVDRAALPAPGPARGGLSVGSAPRTPVEERLAELWREVLKVEEVAREDNFFALGGHSLLATQLVSRMRAALGVDLPLRLIFERPVLADLAAALEGAAPASGSPVLPAPLAPSTGPRSEAPLSFAQERLWFIDRLTGTAAYHMPLALSLQGDLSPDALEAALAEIVRRQGSLRTTFALAGDTPVQVVAPPGPWSLPRVDLTALPAFPALPRAAEVGRLAEENALRPFDLARGPLLRAALLATGSGLHTLLLAMHHIISDGWSMGIVVQEVVPLYAAALAGRPSLRSALPTLPIQYTDYAVWQRQWLAGAVLAEQLDYWRRTLTGAPAELALPIDRPRPARQSHRGARLAFAVEPGAVRALKALLAGINGTVFMGLLAAFQALLVRVTGEDDVVVGSPIANRDRKMVAPLIGFFVNTVVFRSRFDGDLSFRGLLGRVREAAIGAYAHQDLPFERLVETLAVERSLARNPLFQVMLSLENTPMGRLDLPGLRLTPVAIDLPLTQFDLTLTAKEMEDDELAAEIDYSTDLFHATTVARLAGHFQALLAAALEAPDRRLSELPLLSPPELAALQWEWNDTGRLDLPDLLHRQVEARAAASPDRLAVLAAGSGEGLTYGELDRRAGRLARRLRELGIGVESRVGILAGRSPDLVVGMLAVWKAGGAYLPIDPDYPEERIALLREDSRAALLLTAERLREVGDLPAAPLDAVPIDPAAAAYVVYTSGSSGRAKGVVVPHRSLSRYVRSMAERYRMGPEDRFLQFSSLGFDTSVDEIWGPLAAGATLVFRSDEMAGALSHLVAEVACLGVTMLTLPTAFWHELGPFLAEGAATLPPTVRLTILGGEEAQPRSLAAWHAGVGRSRPAGEAVLLLNAYGPTETTVTATLADLTAAETREPGEEGEPLSLGRPLSGVRLHLVDHDLQLVSQGVWGELLIGGTGVARGYLDRPDLTAERFLPDAWGGEPGGRVYRTGDRVRFRPDGELLFGGRFDQQVKIRGFRVEPGEIEAVLLEHPGLAGAAVVARRTSAGDSLLACVVPAPGDGGELAPGTAELQAFLASRLPAHLIPAAFAVLSELPLTSHGKIDRRALSLLRPERPAPAPPETALEAHLARVWSEVLGAETVGRDDSFFALGGHSLAATRLVARLTAALGFEVPLQAIFEAPILSALAARIAEIGRLDRPDAAAPGAWLPLALWRGRGGAEAPLSFAQERLWFVDRLRPGNTAFNMPAPLLLQGPLDLPALTRAFHAVRRRQGSLRTRFAEAPQREGAPVQVIEPADASWWLSRVDLDGLPAPARRGVAERLAAEDAGRPFDLRRGPLFRPLLVRLGPAEHLLLLTCHHIISDGWSAGVLLGELTAGYAGFPVPDLPVQYTDFAVWQRERFAGAALAAEIGYWRRQLAGISPLDLPADRPRRPVPSLRGAARAFRLRPAASSGLAAVAQAQGATLFMALHAGFAAVLSRHTGRLDLPVGTTVANRTRAELEGLIGFFVNTLVLRADISGDPDLPALVARSREVALGAFAHQDLPFERLVDELWLPRDPYRPPLLRVLLQLHHAAQGGGPELPGLILAPFDFAVSGAKFDLVVNIDEPGAAGGLEGELRYDADLFDGPTIERLSGHFERLLTEWAADPGRPLSTLPLLSAGERQQLLVEWNEPVGAPPRPSCQCPSPLHRRFEAQVDRAPDAVAVLAGGERLTYGELDRWANRIAWHLAAAGVRPVDRVALSLERSIGMIAAILGVLKAGAAYVPLDPAQPAERLAFAREDSGASLLLTAGDLEVARGESARRLPRPEMPADPALPAYVIYTSGSTGRPKGVVVSHANVDRLFTVTAPAFNFGPGDAWTLFHSYAFDFSVWEIWGALLHGGRLVVVPYWESRSPAAFYRLLAAERITVLNQTPSAFRQLLWAEEAAPADLALREVIFGGEALEPASLASWFERHGDAVPRLVNMYGITETTVHVTWRPLRAGDLGKGSLLGRPLPDLALHLLDRAFRPLPIGVPGEIHVGGAGLAQGYLGRPDLTALRFVPDPFAADPGARLYRSGDLARRLPDGDLEYLGRLDHQVKIRGFRIELGEIEAGLAAHPGVREAVVLARAESEESPGTSRRLVAYVVPAPGAALDAAALREHLAGRLPEPMLPAAFVFLEALPLTANGKVDRRALPAPEAVGLPATASVREPVPPETALERFLAGQFREVLGIGAERAIGIHDDFFALGGTSISGAIFIHRLQEALGEIVHVVAIFDHPTVAALADYVRAEHPEPARRLWGEGESGGEVVSIVGPQEIAEMRRLMIAGRAGRPEPLEVTAEPLAPPVLFVLSPPRSGSTLLRVMLGAHPRLFAPPELELLSFPSLAERHAAFPGRDRFWLEGLVRAVMEAREVDAVEAERIVEVAERQGWSTLRFYRELTGWLGGRMLVDKTPSYALDPAVLARAESGFASARYLHLVRHPQATNRSFAEAKMEQIFFRRPHPFSRRQLAELVWTVSHENIRAFLAGVPGERFRTVHFEALVREPDRVLAGICDFLEIEFRPEMAEPYRPGVARMVDGPHAVSRMLGDVKFLGHGRVDPAAAERWREVGEAPLGATARTLASALGYGEFARPGRGVLVPLQKGSPAGLPLFCVHPVGGEVVAYRELAERLGPNQPVYGLQSPEPPISDIAEMAALYVEAVREVQPAGPYRLAGWSMGGVVAYEMARQLGAAGERVELLALLDTLSPVIWAAEPALSEVDLVAAFALDLARLSGAAVPETPELILAGLDLDGALALVLQLGRQAGVLAPGVEPAELRRLFDRFRANRRALATYPPLPYAGAVTLFHAAEPADEAGPDLGWSGLVEDLRICELPGDHYSMLHGPGGGALAAALAESVTVG